MAAYAQETLKQFKTKRMFKMIRQYSQWQKSWVSSVRANFDRQRVKSGFRDVYMHTLLARLVRRRENRLKATFLNQLTAEAIALKADRAVLARKRAERMRANCFAILLWNKEREQRLMKSRIALTRRRCHWLTVLAVKTWKLYTLKVKEYKQDPIIRQFVDYDRSVIQTETPGMPLMVMESDDSCKYFDVNAKVLNFC